MALKIERARLAIGCYLLGLGLALATGVRYLLEPFLDNWIRGGVALAVVAVAAGVMLDPDRIRRSLTGRQARYGGNALLFGLGFLGILVVANALAASYPQRIDLTEDKEFSLSPETELLLDELDQPVVLTGFYTPDRASSRDQIRPLLDAFVTKSGGLVSYDFIDPRENPLAADQYGVTRDASMAVTIGESSHLIEFPSEREIASAIVRLTNPENRVVFFLTGHGELDLDDTSEIGLSQLKSSLVSKNYGVETLSLLVEGAVPGNATVLVAVGPRTALSPEEVSLIDGYLQEGGSLIALFEPSPVSGLEAGADTLNAYLHESWGVSARDDFVVDLGSSLFLVGLSASYASHPITERVGNFLTQFPSARSIETAQSAGAERTVTELVQTSERSWGETDYQAIADGTSIEFNEQTEVAGPLALATAVDDPAIASRVVVFGDADFASNGGFFAGGNGDLIVNSIDWAAHQEDLIDITPRQRTVRQVIPATRSTVVLLIAGTTVVVPGAIVAAGGVVWWNRRRRA